MWSIVRCIGFNSCRSKMLYMVIIYLGHILWDWRCRGVIRIRCILFGKKIKQNYLPSGLRTRCWREVLVSKYWRFIGKGWWVKIVVIHIWIILGLVGRLRWESKYFSMMIIGIGRFLGIKRIRISMVGKMIGIIGKKMIGILGIRKRRWWSSRLSNEAFSCGKRCLSWPVWRVQREFSRVAGCSSNH